MKKLAFFSFVCLLNLLLLGQSLEGVDKTHLPVWPSVLLPGVDDAEAPSVKTETLPNGVELEYAEQGNSLGIPVILLHGYADSRRSWETVLPHLPSYLHVFALSQRGHGNSSKHPRSYTPQDFAGDAAAFMKAKGLNEAVIVGHSMGSTVAQCFAATYPARAKAVVLVASFASYDKPMMAEFKTAIDALTDPVDSAFIAEFQKSTFLQPTPGLSFDTIVAESRKLPVHVWKGVAAGWNVSDFRKALTAYTKPVLIVWGNKDAFCSRSDQDELCKSLKGSALRIYEDVGHTPHWEVPERFANELTAFVDSLAKRR